MEQLATFNTKLNDYISLIKHTIVILSDYNHMIIIIYIEDNVYNLLYNFKYDIEYLIKLYI